MEQILGTLDSGAERELILSTLRRTRWNRKRAAQELPISYRALLYKLKKKGIGENSTVTAGAAE